MTTQHVVVRAVFTVPYSFLLVSSVVFLGEISNSVFVKYLLGISRVLHHESGHFPREVAGLN